MVGGEGGAAGLGSGGGVTTGGVAATGAGGFTMANTLSKFLIAWKIDAVPRAPTLAAPIAPGPL
jgi:hypothetical protein